MLHFFLANFIRKQYLCQYFEIFRLMQSITINNLVFDEYLSQEEINTIVADVAKCINADYQGREPLFICVLNGAFMYASDLLKHITLPAEITFVRLKSYEGTATTGKVNMLIPLQTSIQDRDVIIIEDIVDTGLTMHGFIQQLKEQGARSVELTSFLFKPDSLQFADSTPKYIGKSIPTKFVLGYGLDFDEKGRNLPSLFVLRPGE
jgi:hypoxanthine phosphoribosyltransferase